MPEDTSNAAATVWITELRAHAIEHIGQVDVAGKNSLHTTTSKNSEKRTTVDEDLPARCCEWKVGVQHAEEESDKTHTQTAMPDLDDILSQIILHGITHASVAGVNQERLVGTI